jgi:hypothetical protein
MSMNSFITVSPKGWSGMAIPKTRLTGSDNVVYKYPFNKLFFKTLPALNLELLFNYSLQWRISQVEPMTFPISIGTLWKDFFRYFFNLSNL